MRTNPLSRCALAVVLVAALQWSIVPSATAQFGFGPGIGPGIGGYGPITGGYGPVWGTYGPSLNLQVGPGYRMGSIPVVPGSGIYRPYSGYRPVGPSGFGAGYSFVGPPIFRTPASPPVLPRRFRR